MHMGSWLSNLAFQMMLQLDGAGVSSLLSRQQALPHGLQLSSQCLILPLQMGQVAQPSVSFVGRNVARQCLLTGRPGL